MTSMNGKFSGEDAEWHQFIKNKRIGTHMIKCCIRYDKICYNQNLNISNSTTCKRNCLILFHVR